MRKRLKYDLIFPRGRWGRFKIRRIKCGAFGQNHSPAKFSGEGSGGGGRIKNQNNGTEETLNRYFHCLSTCTMVMPVITFGRGECYVFPTSRGFK